MRFRLKTDFLTYARDQIRGGIWYKPAWWEAVHKAPPIAFVPRIKKRDIPQIKFLEDRLIKEFRARNPAVTAFDHGGKGKTTVAKEFVDTQIKLLKADFNEKQAYDLSKMWLIDNGRTMYRKLTVPYAVERRVVAPFDAMHRQERFDSMMESQAALVRKFIRREPAGEGAGVLDDRAAAGYRSFLQQGEAEAISRRAASRDPTFTAAAGPAEAAAAAGAADSSAAAGASSKMQ